MAIDRCPAFSPADGRVRKYAAVDTDNSGSQQDVAAPDRLQEVHELGPAPLTGSARPASPSICPAAISERCATRAQRHVTIVLAACTALFCWAVPSVQAGSYMAAVANPHAAQAAVDIMRRGGSAVDAAVAAQLVLTLVEPQSSGIGGGAFLLHYDAGSGNVAAYDGRETAPGGATEELFLSDDGEPMKFFEAVVGGRSVGVPGVLRMLEMAHQRHGRLPWVTLFQPAIALADVGFAVSPRLNMLIAGDKHLGTQDRARRYFYHADGSARRAGEIRRNPEYASVLRSIAAGGADAFYRGPLAREIVRAVRSAPNPGLLTEDDLAGYRAVQREAVCRPYRAFRVCGMPPPTSGGVTMLQILGILDNFDVGALTPGSTEAVHLISEASRLAYADRGLYLADSDFVRVPVKGSARSWLSQGARLDDRSSSEHGKSDSGQYAPPGRRAVGTGAIAQPAFDDTLQYRRCGRQRRFHDLERGECVRLPSDGARVHSEQPTDRLFVPAFNRRSNRREPGRAR